MALLCVGGRGLNMDHGSTVLTDPESTIVCKLAKSSCLAPTVRSLPRPPLLTTQACSYQVLGPPAFPGCPVHKKCGRLQLHTHTVLRCRGKNESL